MDNGKQLSGKIGEFFSSRSRVAAGGLAALGAVVVAVVRRRRRSRVIEFPDPGPLAAETASSVRNAAKGAFIATVRGADHPDEGLVTHSVETAIAEAAGSGVDLTAVAVGLVEGALEVAHLLELDPEDAAVLAAKAAIAASEARGRVAADRVRDVLETQVAVT